MTHQQPIQPIFILPEGTQKNSGRSAQRTNIMAGKLVAETVRTTLGPKGMDKMLVDSLGEVIVTNDGVTILKEMNIEHPTAKMIVDVAKTQEAEVGDGTTTAVVIAGELLKRAEELLELNIHPTVIVKGYRLATDKAQEILHDIAEPLSEDDDQTLVNIAETAMTGKGAETAKEHLSSITVRAVKAVMRKTSEGIVVDQEDIKIEKKLGARVEESCLIEGLVIDKEKVHSGMPMLVKDAKIALLDSAIEIKNTETDAKIQINDPMQMQAFLDQEERMLRNMVEKIVNSGATVVFCQKGIDDLAQHFLAKKGIFAVRRVKKSDIDALAKATSAKLMTSLDDLSAESLGYAGFVEEKKVGSETMTYVTQCHNPKAVTILIRGGTEHVVAEIKRALEDAVGDIASALASGKVVAGAGACEMELFRGLKQFANSLSGREQLAVNAFADAMEIVPRTLAENAGLDPIDVLTELKSSHDKGVKWAGIDVFTGKVMDAWKERVIEPLKIKTQAISSAAEVAQMILRIDDVIAASSGKNQSPQGQGGMSDMPMM
ncbi:TCP-1/cpn60 chaperonin family protein [Candidatus Woesearchaeota archaeon]|nr:TCP-1/cpn60 chaperonin family protein [Candidatus Woesearchaeota archaeon]